MSGENNYDYYDYQTPNNNKRKAKDENENELIPAKSLKKIIKQKIKKIIIILILLKNLIK